MKKNKYYTIAFTEDEKYEIQLLLKKEYHDSPDADPRKAKLGKIFDLVAACCPTYTDPAQAWHSVKDCLPSPDKDVVVYNGFEYAVGSVERLRNGTDEWVVPTDGYHTEDITAWQAFEPYKPETK